MAHRPGRWLVYRVPMETETRKPWLVLGELRQYLSVSSFRDQGEAFRFALARAREDADQ